MKILFATSNQGKMKEINMILEGMKVESVMSLKDAGINIDIDENGSTFEENAVIKVRALAPYADQNTVILADDSGLVIDALGGEPGIYSARYMGEDTSYDLKNANLIERLSGVDGEERSARFVCVIAALFPDGTLHCATGTMEGRIAYKPEGTNGFGYDPILYLPQYDMTSAQIAPEEKNKISHRGKALGLMRQILDEYQSDMQL